MASELKLERDGAVLVATLDRPERMHAIGTQLLEELPRAWSEAAADPSLRALVITASGDRAFCTGMDLQEAAERGGARPLAANYDSMKVTPLNCDVWLSTIVAVTACARARVCTSSRTPTWSWPRVGPRSSTLTSPSARSR